MNNFNAEREKRYLRIFKAVLFFTLVLALCFTFVGCENSVTDISAVYTGGSVEIGENLNRDDVKVTAFYRDGKVQRVYDFSVSYDFSTVGEKTVTVGYAEKTAVFNVNVVEKSPESPSAVLRAVCSVKEIPVNSVLSKNNVIVSLSDTNGVVVTVNDYTLEYDFSTVGDKTVTVKYTSGGVEYTTSFSVKVVEAPLPKLIALSAKYVGADLYVGDTIAKSDIEVTAYYDNYEVKTVNGFDFVCNTLTEGNNKCTVTYSENGVSKSADFYVDVKAEEPIPSVKLIYIQAEYVGDEIEYGRQLNVSDITVTAFYENDTQQRVTNFNIGGFSPFTVGEQTVDVSYTENGITVSDTVTVTVNASEEEIADYGDHGILQNDNSIKITNTAYVNDDLQIHFVAFDNITSGDCVYIKAGDTDVLIDAGSTAGSAKAISNYISKFCTDGVLEYAIATHAHSDHISAYVGTYSSGGVDNKNGILDTFEIENLIRYPKQSGSSTLSQNFDKKCEALKERGTNVYNALECYNNANENAQRVYRLSENIELEILYNYYYDHSTSNENLNSVCIMINQYGDGYDFSNPDKAENRKYVNHYIFTGDLEEEGEAQLVKNNALPEVVLYKAGHHGSRTASSSALLNVIKPKVVCLCSCAGDRYDFPHQEFIDRVAPFTQMVFQTNMKTASGAAGYFNGNICVASNGKGVFVNCSNNNILMKDADWFKNNRVCPESWKN